MMKYKTFRMIRRIVLLLLTIVIIIILSQTLCKKKTRHISEINNNPDKTNIFEKPRYGENILNLTKEEKEILNYQKSSVSDNDKDKKGESYIKTYTSDNYKIEMRCDFKKGFNYWNRIKVNYNNDKKWDEKWTISKEGRIKREVSPNDDEEYPIIYYLKDDHWLKK